MGVLWDFITSGVPVSVIITEVAQKEYFKKFFVCNVFWLFVCLFWTFPPRHVWKYSWSTLKMPHLVFQQVAVKWRLTAQERFVIDISKILRRNITLFWNNYAIGAALLVQNRLCPMLDCIFPHHIREIMPNLVYQALDGHLIAVTTMGELSLGRPKSGRGPLIKVTWDQAQFERFSYILSNGYRWNWASLFVSPCPPECNFQSETKI